MSLSKDEVCLELGADPLTATQLMQKLAAGTGVYSLTPPPPLAIENGDANDGSKADQPEKEKLKQDPSQKKPKREPKPPKPKPIVPRLHCQLNIFFVHY